MSEPAKSPEPSKKVTVTLNETGAADVPANIDELVSSILTDLKHDRLKLPTLPQLAMKIGKIIDDPNSCAKDVGHVINTDPALSARLIQVANSPLVRGNSKIENVQGAITRMGVLMVKNVVNSFILKQMFDAKHAGARKRMNWLWTHSTKVAAISYALAKKVATHFPPEDLMFAGVIHDIGTLPIISKTAQLPHNTTNEKVIDMVTQKLHAPLGKAILQAWNFKPDFVSVASEHHNLHRDTEHLDYCDIVMVANLHSYIGTEDFQQINWEDIPAFQKMKLSAESSLAVLESARDEIQEIQKLLS